MFKRNTDKKTEVKMSPELAKAVGTLKEVEKLATQFSDSFDKLTPFERNICGYLDVAIFCPCEDIAVIHGIGHKVYSEGLTSLRERETEREESRFPFGDKLFESKMSMKKEELKKILDILTEAKTRSKKD